MGYQYDFSKRSEERSSTKEAKLRISVHLMKVRVLII